MPRCRCIYCNPPKIFYNKELLKEHILKRHKDKILEFLSKMPEYRQSNISNPEKWAARYLAALQCSKQKN